MKVKCPACLGSGMCVTCSGTGYVRAGKLAPAAVEASPGKSNRAIAAETGISERTVRRARPTAANAAVEKRVGKDGKVRKMPKRQAVKHPTKAQSKGDGIMPTEEEVNKEWKAAIYYSVYQFLDQATDTTRQQFIADVRRRYHG